MRDQAAATRSVLGLTADEHIALGRIMAYFGVERDGNEPWERSWIGAHNSRDGRVFASLARKGLIESKRGVESPLYRWRREP